MTKDEIHSEWSEFIDYPDGSDCKFVTTTSALLFAEHVARKSEREIGPLRKAAQQALKALRMCDAELHFDLCDEYEFESNAIALLRKELDHE